MEALQLLRSAAPDTYQLVLTDVCMPELNGIQLLTSVKADASLRAVPVVSESPPSAAPRRLLLGSTVLDWLAAWCHMLRRCATAQLQAG